MTPDALLRSSTDWAAVPFVPEIKMLTAASPYEIWDASARDAPPFWAFPWAGGQGLARYVLDHPETVRGRQVLDVASGSGLVAIAAALAGAADVMAGDIDENAIAAIAANASANGVAVNGRWHDLDTGPADAAGGAGSGDGLAGAGVVAGADVVLAADVFYQRELAVLALRFLRAAADRGADVLVADPGRAFRPADALAALASYEVPVLPVLEDSTLKTVTVYRLK
jgi:predicted nicotinamide N-methyase